MLLQRGNFLPLAFFIFLTAAEAGFEEFEAGFIHADLVFDAAVLLAKGFIRHAEGAGDASGAGFLRGGELAWGLGCGSWRCGLWRSRWRREGHTGTIGKQVAQGSHGHLDLVAHIACLQRLWREIGEALVTVLHAQEPFFESGEPVFEFVDLLLCFGSLRREGLLAFRVLRFEFGSFFRDLFVALALGLLGLLEAFEAGLQLRDA